MEMEGKSDGVTKVIKEGGDGRQEGEGTTWMDILDCVNPLISPILQLEGNSCSNGIKFEQGAEGPQEGEDIVRKQHAIVIMGTDVLDCPGCSTPLGPPIFQCSLGHFICLACRDKLPEIDRTCGVCSRPVLDRCHGVERIVDSVLVPCSYALHGYTAAIPYHRKGEHEKVCLHAPCFCPENGCGFAGTTEVLLGHFTAKHDWPITAFKYYEPFNVPVKAGVHVLHGSCEEEDKDNDSDLFLLHVGYPDAPLHSVSLVRVQAHPQEYGVGCSVGFSWFMGQYQVATLDFIRSSSLSNGLPKCSFCIVPEVRRGGGGPVVLSVTIGIVTQEDEDDNKEGDDDDNDVKVGDHKEEDEVDGHKAD